MEFTPWRRLIGPAAGLLAAAALGGAGGTTTAAAASTADTATAATAGAQRPVFALNTRLSSRGALNTHGRMDAGPALPGPPNPANNLPYHGGPVMHNPTVFTVFWLPAGHYESTATAATDTRYENLQNRFFQDIGGSQFYSVVSQYPDNSGPPGTNVTPGGSVIDTTNAYPHAGTQADPLLDGDIQAEVTRMVNQQGWAQDTNHEVLVYTARNTQECFTAGGECTFFHQGQTGAFCAYHTHFNSGGKDAVYAFMGDNNLGAGCGPGGAPNGDGEADPQVSETSHEFIESVTDPDINAWVGPTDTDEIGDKCNATPSPQNTIGADVFMHGNPYIIQMEWSNVVATCAMSRCGNTMCPTTPNVQKTSAANVTTGQQFGVAISVQNPSDTDADTSVTVVDPLPAGETYVAGSASPAPSSVNGQTLTWVLGTAAVHDQPAITFQALAGADLQNGTPLHNCATVTWSDMLGNVQSTHPVGCADTAAVNQPPVLVLPGDQTGDFHDPMTFTISATDAEATDTLTFGASGLPAGLALTDHGNRTATVSGTPTAAPGAYLVTFSVSDAHNPPVTGALRIIITREETAVAYSGPAVVRNGESSTLSGVLKEDGTAPIAGRTLTLTLGSGSSAQTCSGQTDATGAAKCTIAPVSQPLNGTATLPVTVVFAGDAFYLPSTGTATVRLQFMTGRAYGLSANVSALLPLVTIPPTPDTGQVRTASAISTTTPCTATVSAIVITAHSLCANVTTTLAPGTSTATASLADATIGLPGLPVITVRGLQATSHSVCGSAAGAVTLTLTIGGVPITTSLAPNTVIDLGVAKLVLNEQKPVPGADFGLTVNAVHLVVAGGLASGDVVLGSATSDIHNCA